MKAVILAGGLGRRLFQEPHLRPKPMVQMAGKAVNGLEDDIDGMALDALPELIDQLEVRMQGLAKKLEFEKAADLRDAINSLRENLLQE